MVERIRSLLGRFSENEETVRRLMAADRGIGLRFAREEAVTGGSLAVISGTGSLKRQREGFAA